MRRRCPRSPRRRAAGTGSRPSSVFVFGSTASRSSPGRSARSRCSPGWSQRSTTCTRRPSCRPATPRRSTATSPSAINGIPYGDDTLGGVIADEWAFVGMVAVPLLAVSLVARGTRREEETGRLELLRSRGVGPVAPRRVLVVGRARSAPGGGAGDGGNPRAGRRARRTSRALRGVVPRTRGAVDGALRPGGPARAAVARRVGGRDGSARGCVPGACRRRRPCVVGAVGVAVGVAPGDACVRGRRPCVAPCAAVPRRRGADGRGGTARVWPRPRRGCRGDPPGTGRASGWLATTVGRSVRPTLSTAAAWSAVVVVVGAVLGGLAHEMSAALAANPGAAEVFGGQGTDAVDGYLAFTLVVIALVACAAAVQEYGSTCARRSSPGSPRRSSHGRWAASDGP